MNLSNRSLIVILIAAILGGSIAAPPADAWQPGGPAVTDAQWAADIQRLSQQERAQDICIQNNLRRLYEAKSLTYNAWYFRVTALYNQYRDQPNTPIATRVYAKVNLCANIQQAR